MNFILRERSNFICGDFGDSNGLAIKSSELHQKVFAPYIGVDNCTDVPYCEAMLRQVNS